MSFVLNDGLVTPSFRPQQLRIPMPVRMAVAQGFFRPPAALLSLTVLGTPLLQGEPVRDKRHMLPMFGSIPANIGLNTIHRLTTRTVVDFAGTIPTALCPLNDKISRPFFHKPKTVAESRAITFGESQTFPRRHIHLGPRASRIKLLIILTCP